MAASDIIKLLPDSVANQIAAGEVIQRPASVVKELVENAIDAGATDVSIIIKDAGRTLIQVVDNGCGMSPTDARMAFERHATSKIAAADDLYTLHTMGFRGEALASIAAVAQIELRTMRHGDSIGTRLAIAASRVESQEACACVPGSNLMVKNLFAYLPVRRKFLKKDSVELGHIMHEFERLALVNTKVDFTLIHNDVMMHRLLHGSLRQRICDLFGKTLEKQIIPLSTETSLVRLSGYVGLPQFARRRGAHQYFFVNGRNMRHPYFHSAVMSCYTPLISPDLQPSYFINFEVEPSRIDVNIHPQKHEIKFEDEQGIWQILVAAIKEAMGKTNAAGAIDFDVDNAPEIPTFNPDRQAKAGMDLDESYNPFERGIGIPTDNYEPIERPSATVDWDSLSNNFRRERSASLEEVRSALNIMEQSRPSVRQLGLDELPDPEFTGIATDENKPTGSYITIANRYIATPVRDGLMLIDRHRAHVRVLYERIMSCISDGPIATQRLIFPDTVTLSASEDLVLASICDSLSRLGFDLSPLGDCTWAINGVPSALSAVSPVEILSDIIGRVSQTGEQPDTELFAEIAAAMAKAAAVNANNRMSETETDMLVADLFKTTSPNFTPDGQMIVTTLGAEEIGHLLI